MTVEQLNKLQIKAEILTVLSKLQTNIDAVNIDEILQTLALQEDKKSYFGCFDKRIVEIQRAKKRF